MADPRLRRLRPSIFPACLLEPRPEAPEEVELRVREATNEFARDVMGAVIENRDDGASRIERDGQSWFRVVVTPKTIMTSLGPVTY